MNKLKFTRFEPLSYETKEAFNELCTNITFTGNNVHKIMITSCHASDGKSFISMNLMRSMAQLGYRVLLVDCDLRKSQIRTRYGVQYEEGEGLGLAHYLSGQCKIEGILYETNIPNAFFIPVGREVINPLSLLKGKQFQTCIDQLSKHFDYVFIDAAPVGVVIDAAVIASACDGTLLVVKYNSQTAKEVNDVKEQIERSGCEVLGTVLNDVSFSLMSSKKYYNKYNKFYYSHYYSSGKKKIDQK